MLQDRLTTISLPENDRESSGDAETSLAVDEIVFDTYDPDIESRPFQTYISLEFYFVLFNRELFSGKLPRCLISYQRKKGAYGYFSGGRFVNVADAAEVTDEIALNPAYFARQTPKNVLATLLHEMVHLWQHHFGKPSRNGYHNKEWATMMLAVGLIPSDTGAPGGKQTGERVSHYVEEGGAFDRACGMFLKHDAAVLYQDRAYSERADDAGAVQKRERKAASKTHYQCPRTGLNAWAKPGTRLLCGCCEREMPTS